MSQTKAQLIDSPINLNGADLTFPSTQGSAGQYLRNTSTAGTLEFGDLPGSLSLTRATAVDSTSGTSIDFTNIPANVYRITVMFDSVSLSGSDYLLIRIGDAGGISSAGYISGAAAGTGSGTFADAQSGYLLNYGNNRGAARRLHGSNILSNLTGNTWVSQGSNYVDDYLVGSFNGGVKTLSGTLDRISIVPSGTDTFDSGKINIMYEVQA